MADEAESTQRPPDPEHPESDADRFPDLDRIVDASDFLMHAVETAGAVVFALLFGIGLFDLVVLIAESVQTGEISDPTVVVTFVDRGLLLFIIAEVYQTVVAYVRGQSPRRILRLVIFTGLIAIIRKVIVFRTEVYGSKLEALTVAGTYALLLVGLGTVMLIDQREALLKTDGEETG
ncbi:phosphate-starvation-inducible PsiE family protein [Halobaculum sp. MBLA0143]|uniref:phosphate-starvation-inducible PsiE family protein n=1 Tax=Halobaculum sp. MBLA0143 TaxID=3079933 RepID=UPI003526B679